MDFLTQPFRPPPRRKSHSGSPPPPDSHHQPQPSSPTRGSTRKDSISSHGSSQASSEASTSHTPIHQDHLSRFSQLRTASPLPASGGVNGLPDEEKLVYPSEMAGDWKAFGRVQGRVVVWEKGTVGVVGEKQLREEEKGVGEWVVEGSLWITKADQILLILERDHFPPLPIDRSAALSTRTSRSPSRPSSTRGLSSLARRLSRTESGSSTPVLGGRRRSSVGSLGREGTTTPTAAAAEEDEKSTKSPVLGFLKRVVSPFKRDKGSSPARADGGDDTSLSLQRTRSIELGKRRASAHRAEVAAREQAQQTIKEGKQRASFDEEDEELSTVADDEDDEAGLQGRAIQFEEPAGRSKGPLPDYKGYPITALLIPSPHNIHSVRFFPAQTSSSSHPTSSSSFFGGSSTSSDEPVTTLPPSAPIASASNDDDDAPPEGTISFDALLTGTGGGGAGQDKHKHKNKDRSEVVEYRPPMVELDVVAPIDDTAVEDEMGESGEEGNKAREVTVGFVFKEVLLAQEATTFHHRLLALLPPSHPQSHAHSPTRGRSPSPPPRHESGGGGGGGGFGSALMRTLSGGLSRERSRDPPLAAAAAKEKEKEKDKGKGKAKGKERDVQVQAGEPSLGAPVGRRRSSFFGLVGAGGGSGGVEPTV